MVLYIILGMVAIFVITIVAIVLVARKQGPAIMEARREFFAETGYDDAPPPKVTMSGIEERYVKRLDQNRTLQFHAKSRREPGRLARELTWWMPLPQPAKVGLQIADRSLSSVGKAVKESLTRSSRTWSALYPPVTIADPELDRRFVAFGANPQAVQQCLAAPGLRELLLACDEVDLVMTSNEIRFSDPADKNLKAARGGTSGRIAGGAVGTIRSSIPVHRRIHAILEKVHDSTR